MAEHYRHPFMYGRGTGVRDETAPGESLAEGLRIDGSGVVLISLRRRREWLELRVVNEGSVPTAASIHAAIDRARHADLLGRAGPEVPVVNGVVTLGLGPWEVRTVHVHATSGPSSVAPAIR
jgi:hypothetical protein